MDLNNRRTGKHATKPRALGLLGHSDVCAVTEYRRLWGKTTILTSTPPPPRTVWLFVCDSRRESSRDGGRGFAAGDHFQKMFVTDSGVQQHFPSVYALLERE